MNDPLAQQLLQAVTAYGPSLLEDRARVEQVLAGSTAESPGKVKALLLLLDKKAVSFLANWAKETKADKGTYEQIRQKMSAKFEQANLLTVAAASWALDAWAVALGIIRPVAASAPPPRPVECACKRECCGRQRADGHQGGHDGERIRTARVPRRGRVRNRDRREASSKVGDRCRLAVAGPGSSRAGICSNSTRASGSRILSCS